MEKTQTPLEHEMLRPIDAQTPVDPEVDLTDDTGGGQTPQEELDDALHGLGGGSSETSNNTSEDSLIPTDAEFVETIQYRGYNVKVYYCPKGKDRGDWLSIFQGKEIRTMSTWAHDFLPRHRSAVRTAIDEFIEQNNNPDTSGTSGTNPTPDPDKDNTTPTIDDILNRLMDLFNYSTSTDSTQNNSFLHDWLALFKTLFGENADAFKDISTSDRREFTTMMWQALYQFKIAQYQNDMSQYNWYLQNEYNSPVKQAERMAAAGMFNPFAMNGQASGNNNSAAGTASIEGPTPYQDESSVLKLQEKQNTLDTISTIFGGASSLVNMASSIGALSLTPAQRNVYNRQANLLAQQEKTGKAQEMLFNANQNHIEYGDFLSTIQLKTQMLKMDWDAKWGVHQFNQNMQALMRGQDLNYQASTFATEKGYESSLYGSNVLSANTDKQIASTLQLTGMQGVMDLLKNYSTEYEVQGYQDVETGKIITSESDNKAFGEISGGLNLLGIVKFGADGNYAHGWKDGQTFRHNGKTYKMIRTKSVNVNPAVLPYIEAIEKAYSTYTPRNRADLVAANNVKSYVSNLKAAIAMQAPVRAANNYVNSMRNVGGKYPMLKGVQDFFKWE